MVSFSRYFTVCITYQKYYSGDQIKKNEMAGSCSMYGGQEMHTGFLMGRPDGKRPFGRPGRK